MIKFIKKCYYFIIIKIKEFLKGVKKMKQKIFNIFCGIGIAAGIIFILGFLIMLIELFLFSKGIINL